MTNKAFIEKFLSNAEALNAKIDSIYIEQNGCIDKKVINNIELHELRSCSKLLIAFAYGIIMSENSEKCSLDTLVNSTIFKNYKVNNDFYSKSKKWTIRTLLTHTTGFENMMFSEKTNKLNNVDTSKILDILLMSQIIYEPDTHFTYNNVEPYLLSVFFSETFGYDISDFVNDRIFKQIGIKKYTWNKFGKYCAGATGLYLNHEDFHKIGQLLMNKGRFNGKQIVPSSWIDEMCRPQVDCPDYYKPERVLPKLKAGYFTWLSRDNILFRDGSLGQYIICDFDKHRLITIMSTEEQMSKVTEALRGLI